MRAGRLRHLLTIEEPYESEDAFGEPIPSWQSLAEVWGRKTDLSGRELFQAQQVNAEVTTEFEIRHRTDVDARMRVVCDDICYGIRSVQDPEGLGERTVLLCARTVNE